MIIAAATSAIALPWARQAIADTDSWVGTNGGNWTDGTKWSSAAPPGAGNDVYISNSFGGTQTITYNYNGPGITFNSVIVNAISGGTNVLSMSANSLTVGLQGEYIGGLGASGQGVVNQSGGTQTFGYGSALRIAPTFSRGGLYFLSGGSLNFNTATEYVGDEGDGSFIQSGGTNSLNSASSLYVGNSKGATGSYALSNGILSADVNSEAIGYAGIGNFSQSGGTNSFSYGGGLILGASSGGTGNYNLMGGLLTGGYENLGNAGSGNFNQSGGTNSLTSGALFLGNVPGITGTYTLSAGTISSGQSEQIGYSGPGAFIQSGGINTSYGLEIGVTTGATGTYTLSSGIVATAGVVLGYGGSGSFNQSGGTNNFTGESPLLIAETSGAIGTYSLSGGAFGAYNEYVGDYGAGIFKQSGGTNLCAGGEGLLIGNYDGSTGTYILSAGNLIASCSEYVGFGGIGSFQQTGGTNVISGYSGSLYLGAMPGATGTYTLNGGILNVGKGTVVGGEGIPGGGVGKLTINSPGKFTSFELWIETHGIVVLNGGSMTINLLRFDGGGIIDLTSSAVTVNYGTDANPNASIRGYISTGYNASGSLWTGTGITSTTAASDPAHHSVAFADGNDGIVTHLPAGISSAIPNGGTLPAGTELVTYAYAADANLDGKVDFLDFILLSNHFGTADTNWDHGNFNYDAIVDFADFIILSNDFGAGVTGGIGATPAELAQYNAMAQSFGISQGQIAAWDATISSLPEPGSLSLLALAAAGLLKRR